MDRKLHKNVEFVARCLQQDGHCQVNPTPLPGLWFNYDVLGTDYDTFAVVHGCSTAFWNYWKQESVWILNRQPQVIGTAGYETLKAKAFQVLKTRLPHYNSEVKMRPVVQGPQDQT